MEQSRRFKYVEPFIEERVNVARIYAEKIANGNVESDEDLVLLFKTVISEYYKIPLFSEYLLDRTLDELAFEAHYIRAKETPVVDQATDMISKNIAEAASAAEEAWNDIDSLVPSKEEIDSMADFMNTGNFKE